MDLLTLMDRLSSEEACRAWLEAARWPNGPVRARCDAHGRSSRVRTRPSNFTCLDCRYRYSLTSGTAMHGTHLPLRVWVLALYLIGTSSKGISARKLSEWLGIGYRSAWHLGYRVRAMMAALDARPPGVVEVDGSYVGGRPRRVQGERTLPREKRPRRPKGRATRKPCVFVAVERGGDVRTEVVSSHTAEALSAAVRRAVSPSAVLVSDELPAYRSVGLECVAHHTVRHARDEFARTCEATGLRVHNNTAESFNSSLKRAIVGVFHHLSPKHLRRYASEAAFRWNHRGAARRFSSLLSARSGALPFRILVAA